ncbi:MAG TPA: hypothetical protein VE861_07765, partial [Gemmatimonadaceae bacterium]|nr:hypothetical protein [Gemmatimonadaceae bacterium]
ETGATDKGESTATAAQLEAHAKTVRTAERTRITNLLALSSASIEAALVTAITEGTSPESFAYTQALASKAAKATAGNDEAAAKQKHLEAQAKNEETIAKTGVQLPSAKAVDDKPDARAEKKSRLLAAQARTGNKKLTATT